MNIKIMLSTLIFGLALTTTSDANDINLSWSVRTLQGQALTQTIKQAKFKKYTQQKIKKPKPVHNKNARSSLIFIKH